MTPSQIIVFASPVFLVLMAIELALGHARGQQTYRFSDAITSIGLGMLSQISAVFTVALRLGMYTSVFSAVQLVPDNSFWTTPVGWVAALVFYDFCYYWNHRLGHTCALFWAAHVVHHQSEDYNLSTALRQTSSGALLGWIFYLPMALAGVPPLVFGVVGLIDLLYQYWIHTQQIGKLGWFDRVFASPSNHRVHHAVNDRYLDKNFGGVFMLWDHLFGSFEHENDREPCVYGTRSPLRSWDPMWANLEVYAALWRESWHARRWRDKWRVWFKPPGWQSAEMAARMPTRPFDIAQQQRYSPSVPVTVQRFAACQFGLVLTGSSAFLWFCDPWPLWQSAVWFTVLLVALWVMGAVLQGRIGMLEALMVECGALSMATAANGLVPLHWFFKPLTMLLALAAVAAHWRNPRPGARPSSWLVVSLVGALAGDVFLMLDGFFIPGLVAFLLGHVAYAVLFSRDAPWFASRLAWALLATAGSGFFACLWFQGLPMTLRLPVALYIVAIVAMGSVAIGRARVLRDAPSLLVAGGAVLFMASDATLAINRFVATVSHDAIWVLGTYYMAQCLIVVGILRSPGPDASRAPTPPVHPRSASAGHLEPMAQPPSANN
jgi:alkylglycerol monooxygenase